MKAVNLIPPEQRRGAGGIGGRSGGIVYVVVGTLAVIVALGVVYAFAVKAVAKHKGQLDAVTEQVAQVQQQAAALTPFVEVQSLRDNAAAGVVNLAEGRFNWPLAMQQLVLALPRDVTLTQLNGTASTVAGSSSSTATTTTTTTGGSTFSMAGCASSMSEVATIISDLQRVPSVTSVALENEQKNGAGYTPKWNERPPLGADEAEAKSGGCPFVSWNLTLAFEPTYTVPNQKLPAQTLASGSRHADLTAATKQSPR